MSGGDTTDCPCMLDHSLPVKLGHKQDEYGDFSSSCVMSWSYSLHGYVNHLFCPSTGEV